MTVLVTASSATHITTRNNTINAVQVVDGIAYLQAGAGVVFDSDPEAEHEECLKKLAALEAAIDLAEEEFTA